MLLEEVEVELCLRCERIIDVGIEVYGYQPAGIVRAEGNLAAGVGAYGLVAQVSVAVGNGLADDGVPEEDSGLGGLPCVVDDLLPQGGGVDLLGELGVIGVDGVLLDVGLAAQGTAHELVIDPYGDVGSGHLALLELGVDEVLCVGMLYGDGQHQGSAASVLGHLTGGVGIALHEGHHAGGGEGAVEHRAAGGADMGEVVAYSAAAFHQLHLLLVYLHDAAVGVGLMLVADDEAVGQGGYLVVVADARHRASLGDDVLEIPEQLVNLGCRHRVGVLLLDPGKLVRQAPVHLVRRGLVQVAEGVLHGVLVDPDRGSELIAAEILSAFPQCFVVSLVIHAVTY